MILVTGSTGFLGTSVAGRLCPLAARGRGPAVRLMVHEREVTDHQGRGVETVRGDLSDPASLRGTCDGVDTVLHIAAAVGKDEETCRAVNEEGTRALLAEARRAGVRHVLQMGTSAVYGDGPHAGPAEGEVAPGPTSATSVSRLAGEKLVLAAGGTVVRPYLVYGRGDTWVVPAVVQLLRHFPYWVDEGRPRLSLVAADDLAAAVAALAVRPQRLPAGRVLHGCHPEPVRVRDLVAEVAGGLGLQLPERSLSLEEATARIGAAGGRPLRMLSADHWFTSSRLWQLSGCPAGPGLPARFAQYLPWYRSVLTAR
ncbi:NAD-dependent epimerase/dehydratase family protein [Streptomyces sp. WM6378]|uniref:NAD-dependent epimerase/dehydratase family protein n=1 Tax=Streptomyces sp. WM6378 TaxID=1415557 RepID=UPI0006AF94CD|nr:NAD(P)-dependent oxidoreductase [Streptomyces sp. WM6378]KOU40424.1 hypothetical protein ADK54_22695 [Streptomyces sp. WM6378]